MMSSPLALRRIVVAGATGTIGRAVVRRLVADGHAVTALLRSGSGGADMTELAGAQIVRVALSDSAGLARMMADASPDVVISLHRLAQRRAQGCRGDRFCCQCRAARCGAGGRCAAVHPAFGDLCAKAAARLPARQAQVRGAAGGERDRIRDRAPDRRFLSNHLSVGRSGG